LVLALLAGVGSPAAAVAQASAAAVAQPPAVRSDVCRPGTAAESRGAWRLVRVPLAQAVRQVAERAGWRLSYSPEQLPQRAVSVVCDTFEARAALAVILAGTTVRVIVRDNLLILAPMSPADDRAADAQAAQPLPVQRVQADADAASPSLLGVLAGVGSRVVTLDGDSLLASGASSLGEVLRSTLPGLTAWDRGGGALRIASVRGRGGDGGPGVKVFVDGIEVADPASVLGLDLRGVAHVQWQPGAAGASRYGTDALDGILHFTTRALQGARAAGGGSRALPQSLRVGAAGSRLQRGALLSTDVGAGGAWTRTARPAAGDRTDSTAVRYSLGATGFAVRTGVPVGDRPMTTAGGSWSAMAATARWRVDLNARAAGGRQILSIDPRWSESAPATRPGAASITALDEEEVRDAHAGLAMRWDPGHGGHALQLAVARSDREATAGARRLSLQDSIRVAWRGPVTRWTARYRGEVPLPRSGLTLQLVADASHLTRNAPDTSGLANSLGDSATTQSLAGGAVSLRGDLRRVHWSASLRGEWNDALGVRSLPLWLPSAGIEVPMPAIGRMMWRGRAAFGASARAPSPGMSAARTTSLYAQRANPGLQGERQRALEAGVDGSAGEAGQLAVTVFHQRTDGFVQLVPTGQAETGEGFVRRVVQFRTVGSVEARGVDADGVLTTRWGQWRATGSLARSRVVTLDSSYRGSLEVGAVPLEAPQLSWALSWTTRLHGGDLTIAQQTIGSWSSLAWDCTGGRTATCGNDLRLVAPLTRWHASFAGPPIRGWRWRLRTENLTNEQRVDGSAMLVGPGRSVTVEIGRW
jgi:hypothetical protein